MHLDAAWHIARCEDCRTNTRRQSCAAQSGHLPTPGLAGDVIGLDIKTVTPHDQSPRSQNLGAEHGCNVDYCPEPERHDEVRMAKVLCWRIHDVLQEGAI